MLLPAIYYSISFGLGSVLFAVTGAAAFGSIYHFDTAQVGMAIGLSTFSGTLIGELFAGPVSDRVLYLYTKQHGGESKPEVRLQAMWPGFIILPAGIIRVRVTAVQNTLVRTRPRHWNRSIRAANRFNQYIRLRD